MDVSQYLEIFVEETREHLQSLNEHLLILEKEPENKDTINEIFRAAHSLKGMAGTMGYKRMQNLTHNMESVFSEIRNDKMKVTSELVDTLFQCLDALEAYLDNIVNTQDEGDDDNQPIIKLLNDFLNGNTDKASDTVPEAKTDTSVSSKEAPGAAGFSEVKFADFERHAIIEAGKKNLKVYGINVHIDPNCILKAARAFLVFKSLEEMGEIIKSIPSTQDIEDEKFDFDFSMFIISSEPLDKIISAVGNVSEIRGVTGEEIVIKDDEADGGETGRATSSDNESASKENVKAPAAQSKSSGKPVVNRSVRVDIEKLDVLMNLVSELIIAKNGLVAFNAAEQVQHSQGFNEQIEYLERVTTNLHESVMNVRMVPIENVVSRFPRMIRDLSKKLNKKMELYMSGEDTELDR